MPSVYKLAPTITAHAWSPDRSMVAVCENTEDVFIYSGCKNSDVKKWKKAYTLKGHDLVVSGIDWSPVHNKIVTCSHDRNAFVWTLTSGEWKPSLSILRINRAALSVRWSPDGKKFAVASGAKVVPVCHFEEDHDWWISKMIKKHKSTVLDVAWHPNSQLVATASSDFKCRVFSAYIPEIDAPTQSFFGELSRTAFGDLLAEFDASNGWVESVAWSPSGENLAFVGHDSTANFVSFGQGPKPTCQTIKLTGLPFSRIMFMSESKAVACGHAYNPCVFTERSGFWSEERFMESKGSGAGNKKSMNLSTFDKQREKWGNRVKRGTDSSNAAASLWTSHQNTITDVCPYGDTQYTTEVNAFSTTGLDGRLVVWK